MHIAINLATRPFADLGPALKRLRIAMAVLAVVAIALGFGLHALNSKADAARAREHTLDASIAKVNQERQSALSMMQQPENAQVLNQVTALNKLFDEKAFSWTLAMEDLETVLPGGVQVTTLEPIRDKKDGHITLRLRVVGPRDKAVELIENIEHSHRFLQPRITSESSETAGNNNQQLEPVSASNRVNFDLLADYNPATPEERKAARKKAQAHEESEAATESAQPAEPPARNAQPRPGLQRPPYTGTARPLSLRPGRNPVQKPVPGGPR